MHLYASMVTEYMICAKSEHCTFMDDLLGCAGHLQEAENMVITMPCKLDVAAWVACFALAEFVVIWRWQMALPNEFLKWNLTMLLGMCCYQTSMLVLARGFSVSILSTEKGIKI